jgi:vacuolar-type H+-ATPase subunit I/STV1
MSYRDLPWDQRRQEAMQRTQEYSTKLQEHGRTKQQLQREIERLTVQKTELLNSRFNAAPSMQEKNTAAAAQVDSIIQERMDRLGEVDAQMSDAQERQDGWAGLLSQLEDETRGQ